MKKMINKRYILPLLAVVIIGLIYSFSKIEENSHQQSEVTIDFDAFYPSGQQTDIKQILLKMELMNSTEDVLKFGLIKPEQHQERLSYYFNDFSKDIFLITKSDTIPCNDAHIERTYMDAPKRNFILNFQVEDENDIDKLLIADQIYTGQLLELDIKK